MGLLLFVKSLHTASIGLCLVGAYGALQPRVNSGQEIKTENNVPLFNLSVHSLSVKALFFFKCCILLNVNASCKNQELFTPNIFFLLLLKSPHKALAT